MRYCRRRRSVGDTLVNVILLILAVLSAYGGVLNWQKVLRMPQQPQPVTLASVAAGEVLMNDWITISDPIWDCNDVISYRVGEGRIITRRTLAVFTNETRSVLGVATLSGALTCQDLSATTATGIVTAISDQAYFDYLEKGLKLPDYARATTHLALCNWCSRPNSLLGAILCPILAVVLMSLVVIRLLVL